MTTKQTELVEIDAYLITMIFEVHEILEDIDKTAAWFNTPSLNFGGVSPAWLIYHGRGAKVKAFIRNAVEGNI